MNATAELAVAPEEAAAEQTFAIFAEAAELKLAEALGADLQRRASAAVASFDWTAAALQALHEQGAFPLVDNASDVLTNAFDQLKEHLDAVE